MSEVSVIPGEIVEELTYADARELTDRIKATLTVAHDLIIKAFQSRAWELLGYDTWETYCAEEFAGARMVRLEREQRREIVAEMRRADMGVRAIGSALGVGIGTISRDEHEGVPNGTPETEEPIPAASPKTKLQPEYTTGLDGKRYQRKPKESKPELREPKSEPKPKKTALSDQDLVTRWLDGASLNTRYILPITSLDPSREIAAEWRKQMREVGDALAHLRKLINQQKG